jgi:hypothetical protein
MVVESGQARGLAVALLAIAAGRGVVSARRTCPASAARDFAAIDAGPADIQADSVGFKAARDFEWGVPITRYRDLEASNRERLCHGISTIHIVVHDQNTAARLGTDSARTPCHPDVPAARQEEFALPYCVVP